MGFTSGKEYAELEWPIDIAIAVVWIIFAVNFFGTIKRRRERHLYVAIWFYMATIVTVALLHVVNSIALAGFLDEELLLLCRCPGRSGAVVVRPQCGRLFPHHSRFGVDVLFCAQSGRPPGLQLSSLHHPFLVAGLSSIYGRVPTIFSTVPCPSGFRLLGMTFSIALWAPSWGGMINGLLTLRGRWDRVRTDHTLKFLAIAVTFYGMATFEGPLLSIKSVNALAHYTDWIVGHVHAGTIGWNYMFTAGMLYYLVPRLWKVGLYSSKLANMQFWMATFGLILYIISMWVSGITQGMMWMAISPDTGTLVYPHFIETVTRIIPMYWVRAIGGTLVLASFAIMIYNFYRTIKRAQGKSIPGETVRVPKVSASHGKEASHRKLEGLPTVFAVLVVFSVLVGTIVEIAPTFMADKFMEKREEITPYTPLELLGRDIYIREGCYTCHSQMIRPLASEKLRYGEPSHLAESMYDHPFQWGSRRIGPDLARVGGKYPDMWHYRHMIAPQEVTPGSIMPNYPWLIKNEIDYTQLMKKLRVMRALGVPYKEEEIQKGVELAKEQADEIATVLAESGVPEKVRSKEIVALIAYLQRLGVDLETEEE